MPATSPILQELLVRAQARALRLHSSAIDLEHLIGAALEDEESAAAEAIVFAFADPETLDQEVLALTEGMMVVGSKGVLPFSPRAVCALRTAHAGAETVGPEALAHAAAAELPAEQRALLEELGFTPEPTGTPGPPAEAIFRTFDSGAKQALSLACKAATAAREATISPARVLTAALQAAQGGEVAGLRATAAREALRGGTLDPTPPEDREIPVEPGVDLLLGRLGPRADTLDLLGAVLAQGSAELRAAFARHRITPELVQRARSAWADESDR